MPSWVGLLLKWLNLFSPSRLFPACNIILRCGHAMDFRPPMHESWAVFITQSIILDSNITSLWPNCPFAVWTFHVDSSPYPVKRLSRCRSPLDPDSRLGLDEAHRLHGIWDELILFWATYHLPWKNTKKALSLVIRQAIRLSLDQQDRFSNLSCSFSERSTSGRQHIS